MAGLRKKLLCEDCRTVIFDSQSNSQFRVRWLKNWTYSTMMSFLKKKKKGRSRERLCDCVLACVSFALTLSRLVSHHHGFMWLPWQHHIGSTCSAQSLYLLFLLANWLTPPNDVFKAVFFTVWCSFCVPTACAAVNRLLESCCFFVSFFGWFVLFLIFFLYIYKCVLEFVLSAPGAILRSVSVTDRCTYCPLSVLATVR